MKTAPKPWIFDFLLLAAVWGASFLFMRTASVEMGAVPTAAVRVAIAALTLLPLLVWRGQMPALRQHWKPVLLVGMLNSGVPFALFSFALLSITTGLSSILNATTPLFGTLIAWLWLKDRPNASRSLGLVIGFIGVALLAWDKASFKPDSHGIAPGWAVLACLLAATCYGITGSYTKRFLNGVPPLVTATGSQIGAALGLALPALWLWPAQWPSLHAWAALLVVGTVSTALAYIIFFRLIANIGPAKALTVTFVVPVFAVLYGAVFLGEALTPWMVGCGLVVVCGTALATGLLRLPTRH
ncbi:MAG: DMT family transporter [Rhodoferax sp.]|uniref:DMT family transporter n=1 Tax=Rhodoferax sp. TaxID=50421 RepID=UPI0032655E66